MVRVSKKEAAERLIDWHFKVEPELREVYLIKPRDAADEPIKLVEVNGATVATGSLELFAFILTDEVPYRTFIAQITPDELTEFKSHPEKLPTGWTLGDAERFTRPKAA